MFTKEIIVAKKPLNIYIRNKDSKKNVVLIFLNGLNSDQSIIEAFNHQLFSTYTIITFNTLSQFENKQKHTYRPSKYVEYTKKVVEAIKNIKEYKNKKFVLFGESFGASIGLLTLSKYNNLVDKAFFWNSPTKISPTKLPEQKISIPLKSIFTLLTGIETTSIGIFDENLTSNPVIKRINKVKPKQRVNTKATLACWLMMKKVRKVLIKKLPSNVYYVQSQCDITKHDDTVAKMTDKNITIFKTGHHLLSFEIKESKMLFDKLNDIIRGAKW